MSHVPITLRNYRILSIITVIVLSVVVPADAGNLATTDFALFDGFGPDGGRWRGLANINAAVFGNDVEAVVEWAAFAPGKFQDYLDDQSIAQVDPSDPNTEVVYAYQIVSVTSANPGISTLSVQVDPGDARGSVSAPAFVPAGGASEVNPTSGGDGGTQMNWDFVGNLVGAGDTTGILVFSSPFAPELGPLQLSSGLAGPIPSPEVATISDRIFEQEIPEPASIALVLFAGSLATLSRRRLPMS